MLQIAVINESTAEQDAAISHMLKAFQTQWNRDLSKVWNTPQAEFKFIAKGEAFAVQNGQPVRVAEDTHLLIPMKADETRVHKEVGYLGRKVRFEPAKAAS